MEYYKQGKGKKMSWKNLTQVEKISEINIYRKTVFGQNFLADVGRRNELKNLS